MQNIDFTKDTLISLEILNEKSTNIYEKFGMEFSGNCYACDLAEIKIAKDKIWFTNVCDAQNNINISITNLKVIDNIIALKTKNYTFVFTQINAEPIYSLEILNGNFEKKNFRISKYFTFKKSLPKFNVHDCGDFQG